VREEIFSSDLRLLGFEPSTANLATFTNANTGTNFLGAAGATFTAIASDALSCTGTAATGFTCTNTGANGYITRAGAMPGAYTSSPQKLVSVNPDWGCGTNVTTGGTCVADGGTNIADRVLNNNTTNDGNNTAPGTGVSDAVTACGITGGCSPDGQLVGTYTSVVNFNADGSDGMPDGSITFTRTPNATTSCRATGQTTQGCSDVTLSQSQTQTIAGLYTFGHTDVSLTPFNSVAARSYGNVTGATGATLNTPRVNILSVTTLTQDVYGGDAESTGGSDTQTWGTLWTNGGAHPGGNFFTPGLNNANSAIDNSIFLGTPANPVDAAGFRQ